MVKENVPLGQAASEAGIVLCVLAALYVFLSWRFSHSSGWLLLRAAHRVEKVDFVQAWLFESASFDKGYGFPGLLGRYRSCLKFGYTPDGVYMSGMFPFVLFHQPILIPWKDAVVTATDGYLLYSMSVPNVSISISKKVYDGLVDSKLIQNTNSLLGS